MEEPIILSSPVKGEWHTPNTPGNKIPSHGSDKFGTTYAYDFVQLNWQRLGKPAYRGGLIKYLTKGIPVEDYYCWGELIYSPCDGEVMVAQDGFAENTKTNLINDFSQARNHAKNFNPINRHTQEVAGNYIIIKMKENIFVALCHLQKNSIRVSKGDQIKKGDVLAKIGHSGNSFGPHLHLQAMDRLDIANAKGLPCAFADYEVYDDGKWQTVKSGIPKKKDRLRFTGF